MKTVLRSEKSGLARNYFFLCVKKRNRYCRGEGAESGQQNLYYTVLLQ